MKTKRGIRPFAAVPDEGLCGPGQGRVTVLIPQMHDGGGCGTGWDWRVAQSAAVRGKAVRGNEAVRQGRIPDQGRLKPAVLATVGIRPKLPFQNQKQIRSAKSGGTIASQIFRQQG